MSQEHDKAVTYTSYLKVDELLALQQPLSDGPEHDELLFITIHQVYELWFKQVLHECSALQATLESGNTHRSLALLGRVRTIMKTCVAQLDILETMTPLQFNSFRGRLSSASGFQSAQFRELEAVLGRRDQIRHDKAEFVRLCTEILFIARTYNSCRSPEPRRHHRLRSK